MLFKDALKCLGLEVAPRQAPLGQDYLSQIRQRRTAEPGILGRREPLLTRAEDVIRDETAHRLT